MSQSVDVEVLVKPGCHLCAEALEVTEAICAELGLDYTQTNVEEDPALATQFAEEIPVLRINGQVRDFWKFDSARMRRLLTEAGATSA
ncbi:glutaredoxin family protein [Nesterenkonia alba]|uniref:glutaredoxin family protein n=1 Tax=Nesterenkonia alba TaxID=515814 RepID=UPI0003B45667|nr:glutaredoxin family protein [Nesterenkonia alba]